MLKKFESDLFYLILKSIDRYNDIDLDGYVIHPNYLSTIIEDVEGISEKEIEEIKQDLNIELEEGSYLDNENFLENLDQYFNKAKGIMFPKQCTLYQIIKECYTSLKS